MITVAQAEHVHAILVAEFGGATGLRDRGALESCMARPYQTFGGDDLHATAVSKAAAMLEGVIIRHPWLDGNKRTAYVLMELVLATGGLGIRAGEDEKYAMTLSVAEGRMNVEQITEWLRAHSKPL